jgi:hypothetical protein
MAGIVGIRCERRRFDDLDPELSQRKQREQDDEDRA